MGYFQTELRVTLIATNWFIFTVLKSQITELMFTNTHPSLQKLQPVMSGHSRRPVATTSLCDKLLHVCCFQN